MTWRFFDDNFKEKLKKDNNEVFHTSWKLIDFRSVFEGEMYAEETNIEANSK